MISCAMRICFTWNKNGLKLEEKKTFEICRKNFNNFDFSYCKIIGLEVEENVFFFKTIPTTNKVWLLLECNLRTKICGLEENFISYIYAKFQKPMRIFAKNAQIFQATKKIQDSTTLDLSTWLKKYIFPQRGVSLVHQWTLDL